MKKDHEAGIQRQEFELIHDMHNTVDRHTRPKAESE